MGVVVNTWGSTVSRRKVLNKKITQTLFYGEFGFAYGMIKCLSLHILQESKSNNFLPECHKNIDSDSKEVPSAHTLSTLIFELGRSSTGRRSKMVTPVISVCPLCHGKCFIYEFCINNLLTWWY